MLRCVELRNHLLADSATSRWSDSQATHGSLHHLCCHWVIVEPKDPGNRIVFWDVETPTTPVITSPHSSGTTYSPFLTSPDTEASSKPWWWRPRPGIAAGQKLRVGRWSKGVVMMLYWNGKMRVTYTGVDLSFRLFSPPPSGRIVHPAHWRQARPLACADPSPCKRIMSFTMMSWEPAKCLPLSSEKRGEATRVAWRPKLWGNLWLPCLLC